MLRAIIVDDELPAINMMSRLLENSQKALVKATFDNANEALYYLNNNAIDVVFLDIEMPDVNGLEVAHRIATESMTASRCKVVFITAYNHYAAEAFEVNALDYLLKPVKRERLNKTLDKLIEEMHVKVAPAKMKVKCFGKFEIYADKKRVKFRTKKAEELMAILIDHQGKPVARSMVIDYLWADFEGDKALINLNTTLSYVRKALSDVGLDIPIVFDRGSYRIDIQNINIECDYFQFDSYMILESHQQEKDLSKIEKILELYRDDYFAVNNYEWAISKALNLKEKYTSLILWTVEVYSNTGYNKKAIELLKEVLLKESMNDAIIYNLMELLTKEKKYSLALTYYESYKESLRRLGRKPDNTFKRLIEKIYI